MVTPGAMCSATSAIARAASREASRIAAIVRRVLDLGARRSRRGAGRSTYSGRGMDAGTARRGPIAPGYEVPRGGRRRSWPSPDPRLSPASTVPPPRPASTDRPLTPSSAPPPRHGPAARPSPAPRAVSVPPAGGRRVVAVHALEQPSRGEPAHRRRVLGHHRDPGPQQGRHRHVVEADERDAPPGARGRAAPRRRRWSRGSGSRRGRRGAGPRRARRAASRACSAVRSPCRTRPCRPRRPAGPGRHGTRGSAPRRSDRQVVARGRRPGGARCQQVLDGGRGAGRGCRSRPRRRATGAGRGRRRRRHVPARCSSMT